MENPPTCTKCATPESCSCSVSQSSSAPIIPPPIPTVQNSSAHPVQLQANPYYTWAAPYTPHADTPHIQNYPNHPYYSGWQYTNGAAANHYYPVQPFAPHAPQAAAPTNTLLGNITSSIINTPHTAPGYSSTPAPSTSTTSTKRKRKPAGQGSGNSSKRHNGTGSNENQTPAATPSVSVSVPGVGPQVRVEPSFVSPPAAMQSHGSVTAKPSGAPKSDASDVWFFVRGLPSRNVAEAPSLTPPSMKQPSVDDFPAIGCRLCILPKWTTWKNCEGQTKNIRKHLSASHQLIWEELVTVYKLKGWETIQGDHDVQNACRKRSYEPFSMTGFNDRLMSFIAASDQAMGVVDCEEFRELLEFLCPDLRAHGSVPHRTKLSDMVNSSFQRQYESLLSEIENSLGRVSFTSDVWSRQNLQSYMAVTAHYLANSPAPTGPLLTLQTRLVAFRVLHGSHTGVNLGQEFVKILEEIKCLHKISMITLDNASNNQTMCSELERELHGRGIPFDHEGNRVRCFPHVINIAVQTGLKHLTKTPSDSANPTDWDESVNLAAHSNAELLADILYFDALRSDVIAKVRRCVNACKRSVQRREHFSIILQAGNESGGWGDPKKPLRDIQLKNDVDTRWSSLFNMVDTFLELYPVIAQLISEIRDLAEFSFTEAQITVLKDIRFFLQIFHYVQELVSAEKTPTLSLVLPLYEILVSMLKDLSFVKPKLAHAIKVSISKLEEYLNISRGTKMYILAMVINPKIKFEWLQDNWQPDDYSTARSTVINALSEYEKATRAPRTVSGLPPQASRRLVKSNSVSHKAAAQVNGFSRIKSLRQDLRKSKSLLEIPATQDDSAHEDLPQQSAEELARQADEAGLNRVKAEIKAYEDAGLIDENEPLDLLRFWQDHMTAFPLFYRIALDVLPAQASAVPCERVFSSSKETDTNRRANLSPEKMEKLQILKFGFRGKRLNFTDERKDRQMSVLDVSPDIIKDMYARGEIPQLDKYIKES